MEFNPGILLTFPIGILKLVQMALCLVIVICKSVGDYYVGGGGFIWFTAVSALVTVIFFSILYVLGVKNIRVWFLPWQFCEMLEVMLWTVFYVISAVIAVAGSIKYANHLDNRNGVYGAIAFFCILATLAFGVNAFLLYQGFRSGEFGFKAAEHNPNDPDNVQQTTVTTTTQHTTYASAQKI